MCLGANRKICLHDEARRIATVFDKCKQLIKIFLSHERKRNSQQIAHMQNLLQEGSPKAKRIKNCVQLSFRIHPLMPL